MISLGDEVEDTITGFRGIVIARHSYIASPNNVSVQPVIGQYGELPETQVFTESLLKVIKAKEKKVIIVKELKKSSERIFCCKECSHTFTSCLTEVLPECPKCHSLADMLPVGSRKEITKGGD